MRSLPGRRGRQNGKQFSHPDGSPPNALRANGNVYINAGEDLSDNGIVASIVLQNTIDQDGNMNTNGRAPGPDANAEFSGEISVSRCNFMGNTGVPIPTNCAPADAQNANSFVVFRASPTAR
ncbi:hypothetical protein GCM10027270_35180 [Nocardioides ginkgobilobae]